MCLIVIMVMIMVMIMIMIMIMMLTMVVIVFMIVGVTMILIMIMTLMVIMIMRVLTRIVQALHNHLAIRTLLDDSRGGILFIRVINCCVNISILTLFLLFTGTMFRVQGLGAISGAAVIEMNVCSILEQPAGFVTICFVCSHLE